MLLRRPLILLTCAALASGAFYAVAGLSPEKHLSANVAALQATTDRVALRLDKDAQGAADLVKDNGSVRPTLSVSAELPAGLRIFKEGTVLAWTDRAPIDDAVLDTAKAGHLV
ncbi:MAG: hypothetical protein WAT41_08080, partial [Flavobacteriales bacterium]